MSGGWKEDILLQLKKRNRAEVSPFTGLFQLQARLSERNAALETENRSLTVLNEGLRQDKLELAAALAARAGAAAVADSATVQELQQKMFCLQEELTEMHRRKGENAQQVIDLSAALKVTEKEIRDLQQRIEGLEAELLVLRQDLLRSEANTGELESTNQLLKDEYQALQLALNTAENKLNQVNLENNTLVTQLMALKAKDAERMNLENDLFMLQKQKMMQIELAEAASEFKNIPESNLAPTIQNINLGVSVPQKAAFKFDAHEGEVMCVRWDFAGRYFATSGTDRKIKVWENSKYHQVECKATLVGSNATVMGLDFDQNGTMVLGASNDFATRIWTVDDCRLRHTLTGHSGKVLSAKFFGDATRVVSGSHDRTLKVWDLRSKACVSTKFAGSSCNDVVTTEQAVISGHFDKKVRFWDIRSSSTEPMQEIVLEGKVTSLDLTKDKNLLGVCSRDDKIKVLDLRTNGVLGTFAADGFHVGCDWSRISFSPDGEYICAGAGDGSVYVWKVGTGAVETVLREHAAAVYAVCWDPAGASIISVDKAKTCVVWSDL